MAGADRTYNVRFQQSGADNVARSTRGIGQAAQTATRAVRTLATSVAALAGLSVGIGTLRTAFDGLAQQERSLNQLRAAIVSTGRAANRSFSQLTTQANNLQSATTFANESIQDLQSRLLRFTNIANEQFDRSVVAVTDLASAMGTDLSAAAIQVGRALNDPINGLGALSRVGIQFSNSQRDLIKNLAQTGRLAEAQTVILNQLEMQFGGSARAATQGLNGALRQLRNTFDDVLRDLVLGGREAENTGVSMSTLELAVRSVNRALEENNAAILQFSRGLASAGNVVLNILVLVQRLALFLSSSLATAFNAVRVAVNAVRNAFDRLESGFRRFIAAANPVTLALRLMGRNAEEASRGIDGLSTVQQNTEASTSALDSSLTDLGLAFDLLSEDTERVGDSFSNLIENSSPFGDFANEIIEQQRQIREQFERSREGAARFGDTLETAISEKDIQRQNRLRDGVTGLARDLGILNTSGSRVLSAFTNLNKIFTNLDTNQQNNQRQAQKTADGVAQIGTAADKSSAQLSNLGSSFTNLFSAIQNVFSGIGNVLGSLFRGIGGLFGFSKGGAFSSSGVQMFARGGIVDSPTPFGMQGGIGVAGEAGPEAILPLSRGPGGTLGVNASGFGGSGGVNINVIDQRGSGEEVQVVTQENNRQIDIIIRDAVQNMFADGTMDSQMRNSFGAARRGTLGL